MLLWVLIVACSEVPANEGRTWWITMLSKVSQYLGITDENDLRGRLRCISWTDVFFDELLDRIWDEVLGLRCTLTLEYEATMYDLSLMETGMHQVIDTQMEAGYEGQNFEGNGLVVPIGIEVGWKDDN